MALHPFEGRYTHQTLGFLILRRIKKLGVQPFGFVANDYSILFSFSKEISEVLLDKWALSSLAVISFARP